MADAATFADIERHVRAVIASGLEFALNAPYPEPEEVDQHVYA